MKTKNGLPFEIRKKGTSNEELASQLAEIPTQGEKAGLSGWLRDFLLNRNKKVTTIGDSTADPITGAQYIWSEMTSFYTGSGDVLEGITFTHRGANGNTLQNFLANTPAGKGIEDVIADQADLYIFTYGINDVRLGATTQQQLIDRLDTAVQRLLKETKGYILLRVPNSFLSDDPGNTGWLTPLSSAQAYTDLIWNAYMSFKGKYSRVDVLDMQSLVFGRTCNTLANSPLMADILHPSVEGYRRIGRAIAGFVGIATPIREELIKKAITDNVTKPYLIYPKYLESRPDLYEVVAQGYLVGMGSTYLDFDFSPSLAPNVIKGGYIIKIGDVLVYDLPSNVQSLTQGNNTRLINVSFPDHANNKKGMVKVFKLKAVSPVKSMNFWGTNMSGLQFAQYGSLDNTSIIKTFAGQLKNPLATGSPTTFDVKVSSGATVKTLGTLSFPHNNMTATFTWNTSDYPNSSANINNTDFLFLVCGTTTHTGEIAIRLGVS